MTCDASRAALPMCGVACQWGAPRLAVLGVGRTVGLASEKALASADEALGVGRPGSRRSGGPQDSGQSVGVWWNQHPGRGPQYLFHAPPSNSERKSRVVRLSTAPPGAGRARAAINPIADTGEVADHYIARRTRSDAISALASGGGISVRGTG